MLLPLGILASSGGANPAYELITTTVLGSTTASITFDVSTLSATYKHLQIRAVTRGDYNGQGIGTFLRFNSDTNNVNYAAHALYGTGSGSPSSFYVSGASGIGCGDTDSATGVTNSHTPFVIDLLDPFATTKNKTIRSFTGYISTYKEVELWSGLWMSTAAATSLTFLPTSGSWVANSRFSLYGIRG